VTSKVLEKKNLPQNPWKIYIIHKMRFWGVTVTLCFPLPPCGKATKGRTIKVETILDRSLASCRGSGDALAPMLWPICWPHQQTSLETRGLTMHPGCGQAAWGNNKADRGIRKRIKTSEESNHSSEASGATPDGCARVHPSEQNTTENGWSPCKKSGRTSKRVLTLPSRLEGYCRGP
jgi:hypothetical protein